MKQVDKYATFIRTDEKLKTLNPPNKNSTYRILLVKKHTNKFISKNVQVALLENVLTGEKINLMSPMEGVVVKFLTTQHDLISISQPFAVIKDCPHEIVFNQLCALCAKTISAKSTSNMISMIHNNPCIKLNEKYAMGIALSEKQRLLKSKKLILLLDLDQTLLHTTVHDLPREIKQVHHFIMNDDDGKGRWYHTSLRYGLKEFLKTVDEYFELHICTLGTRQYANAICKIIDPDGFYFGDRILSRDELVNSDRKTGNLKLLFPSGYENVIIIDDSSIVWENCPNLIQAYPYVYFKDIGDINSPNVFKHSITNENYEPMKKIVKFDCLVDSIAQNNIHFEKKTDYLKAVSETLINIYNLYFENLKKSNGKGKGTVCDFIGKHQRRMFTGLSVAFLEENDDNISKWTSLKSSWIQYMGGTVTENVILGNVQQHDCINITTHAIIPNKNIDHDKLNSIKQYNKNCKYENEKIILLPEMWIHLAQVFMIRINDAHMVHKYCGNNCPCEQYIFNDYIPESCDKQVDEIEQEILTYLENCE